MRCAFQTHVAGCRLRGRRPCLAKTRALVDCRRSRSLVPACASSSPSWGWSSASGRPDTEAAEAEQTEDDWTARFQSDQERDIGFKSLRAARAVGDQVLSLGTQLADVWTSSLLVLLPASVPAQTVRQLVFVSLGLLAVWVLKSLLSTLVLVGASTLACVCLARWLNFSDAFTERYDEPPQPRRVDRRSAPIEEQQPPPASSDGSKRPPVTSPLFRRSRDLLEVWYE